jgi:hypothetical protein
MTFSSGIVPYKRPKIYGSGFIIKIIIGEFLEMNHDPKNYDLEPND